MSDASQYPLGPDGWPVCAECGASSELQTPDGAWWCDRHYAEALECPIIVTVDGVAAGTRIGTCAADGRPIFRSHMAGTIYHASEDR